ncbi:MAG: PIG-L family deacetylase, partial [Pseudomonadales bacterium]|nr:PIG-L family deacetylase [Pseudomonadales bacterium]
MPKQPYDSIYLSPHLDDVPLSCGGQVYQETSAGRRVLVVTLVAGRPTLDRLSHSAQYLHQS